MGLKVAVASGNWSNPATWNGGKLPSVGDTIASNNFTVTIDQNVNVNLITNTVQSGVAANPVMTSATTPSGIVTSSSNYDAARAAWNAFASSGMWISTNYPVMPQWIAYEFTSAQIIDTYSFTSGWSLAAMPKDFVFQGWNGSSWVTLHTVTGNTSSTYASPSIGNTTAYIAYRFSITLINQTNPAGDQFVSMAAIKMFLADDFQGSSVAGGGFVLGENVTLNCTGSIPGGATTVLTWNGAAGTTSTINTPVIYGASVASINNVLINGTGTLNINATITGATSNVGSRTLFINSNCTVNIVGNVAFGPSTNAVVVIVGSVCTLNITGTITHSVGSGLVMLSIGNVAATVNITGSVICNANSSSNRIISIGTGAIVTVTGSITNTSGASDTYAIDTSSACSLRIIGSITAGSASASIRSTSSSAINLFTGPFISSTYGFAPFQCTRMHLIPNAASYFEFRDETTNGAVSPGAIAPAARLVSPGAAIDAPIAANVRSGISYASGTLLGTMIVPSPSNVANNVPVDNTVGTAVLDPNAIWSVSLASINTLNSIGRRVKNAATVETTGAQIESILNSL